MALATLVCSSETHKILGNTYGMLVLQDFEAMTPNILARTVETIEGGGLVVLLLQSVKSLRQLYTLTMVRMPPHASVALSFLLLRCKLLSLVLWASGDPTGVTDGGLWASHHNFEKHGFWMAPWKC